MAAGGTAATRMAEGRPEKGRGLRKARGGQGAGRKDRGDQVGCRKDGSGQGAEGRIEATKAGYRKDGSGQSGCGGDRVREKEPVLLALACAFFASLENSWKLLEKIGCISNFGKLCKFTVFTVTIA